MTEKVTALFPYADPDHVLEAAKGVYQDVFVIGYDKDGVLDVRASKGLDAKSALFLVEQFKTKLLKCTLIIN